MKKNTTKRSLALSVLSLVLCVAMLLGTTFAWFTDSVTSGKNQIIAGNLDVELYANGTKVDGNTKLFSKVALWEPGAVAFDTLQVKNVGNLALKYQLSFLFENETKVDGHGLSEVLKIGTYAGEITDSTKREDVIAGLTDVAPIASFAKSGNLAANTDGTAVTYVIYWQPGDNDNLYNMNNEKKGKELSIDFHVKLVATQDTVEADSFDKNYDAGAPWLGGVGELPEAKDGVIEIASAEQLAALSAATATTLQNKTVKLVKDIDLNNVAWKPVSVHTSWTFDGNGHTILNLNVASNQRGNGLFSWCPGLTVKNLTVDGAKISGLGMDGVIAGNGTCIKVDKCTVKNAEVISNPNLKDSAGDYNGDKSGIIVGYLCADPTTATVTNCVVEDSKITGYRQCGGIVGYVNGANASATGNKADKIEITIDATNNYKGFETQADYNVNGAIGQVSGGSESNNTATNVTILTMLADGLAMSADGNTFSVSNAAGLVNFAADIDRVSNEAPLTNGMKYKGKTVEITSDIDLANVDWNPIHLWYNDMGYSLTIDGKGHTIKNMKTSGGYSGFISNTASIDLVIKDLKFEDSVQTGNGAAAIGVVIGQMYGHVTLNNVDVKNAKIIGEGTTIRIGTLVGDMMAEGSMKLDLINCDIEGSVITGFHNVGGVIGQLRSAVGYVTATNCTLKNCDLTGTCARADVWPNCVGEFACNGSVVVSTIEGITPTNVTLHKPDQAG